MRKGMDWKGLVKGRTFGWKSDKRCGGGPDSEQDDLARQEEEEEQPSKDVVLDHIILDLTGKSVPLDHIADASTQRAFKRKKRLLRHSNTVLISRLGIMALVTIMLVITTLLTWYFTSTYSARSVKTLASDLRNQLMRSSLQVMVSVLGEVFNATLVLSSLHQQVYHSTSNHSWPSLEPELRRANRGVFNAQIQYSSVAFVSNDNLVTDYSRSRNLTDLYFFVNTTSANSTWYMQDVTGYINESLAPPPMVRSRPYPLSAENLLDKRPSQVYWTLATNIWNESVVSPAVPVRDIVTADFLGLATITSRFTNLNTYLNNLDLLNGILYFDGYSGDRGSTLVAFSYNSTTDTLSSPMNSSNPIVRAAGQFLASTFDFKVLSENETSSENVKLVGNNYYIDTVPLTQQPYNSLNLTAVLLVPRKSIMGQIDKRNRTVIRVSVGTAVGVLVLGCIFICFLTSKMSTEMQLRQELIRLLVGKHRAEQSSNYKTQFLANMSHELRTPIAAIIGLLDLLSCDSLTPDQEISLSQIRNCSTGLLALVNNVLDISKVEAGRMELEVAPFNITDELEALVDIYAVQSARSNIDVVLDLSEDIPPVVKGDATRIRQIFSNLLSNSIKFTTEGHVLLKGWVDQSLLEQTGKQTQTPDFRVSSILSRARVSGVSYQGADNQMALVFELHDTGCGIPVELHQSVFDSFVQADSSTTRTHGGSGLGLYIVRSLVELMGGEIAIIPCDGPGTLMRFHVIVDKPDGHHPFSGILESGAGGLPLRLSSYSSEPEWFNSVLQSPTGNPLFDPPAKRPSPGRAPAVVAMQDGVAQKAAVKWLEKDGLKVFSINSWEDIIPNLEDVLKRNEPKSGIDGGNAVAVTGLGVDSGYAHKYPTSTGSPVAKSSQAADKLTDGAKSQSVLALIDVTMHSNSMEMGFDGKFLEPSVLGPPDLNLNRPHSRGLPAPVQDMLDGVLRLHSQYTVAVAWIVAPDCRARWKQALQTDGRFLVVKKPLTGTRMRQLLGLLSKSEKFGQHHWDAIQSQSSRHTTRSPSLLSLALSITSDERNPASLAEDSGENSVRTPTHPEPESLLDDATSQDPFPDGQQQSGETSPVREFVSRPGSHEGNSATKSDYEIRSKISQAEIPENSRIVGFDVADRPSPGAAASVLPAATTSPSIGLQRVFPVDIPNDTNETLMPGASPEAEEDVRTIRNERGIVSPGNFGNGRDLEEEWQRPGHHTGHDRTAGSPPVSTTIGQPQVGLEHRISRQPSHEIVKPVKADVFSGAALNSVTAFKTRALSSLHILLVEDTPVLQRLASMMLKKLGANVTVVGDGQQAVTAVADAVEAMLTASHVTYFDLILMDCAMPVMDGYNATIAIRAAEENTDRHIPIVALTAHALASDEERCLSVGMDAYLTKPIDCQLMVTTIQELVTKARA